MYTPDWFDSPQAVSEEKLIRCFSLTTLGADWFLIFWSLQVLSGDFQALTCVSFLMKLYQNKKKIIKK